MAHDAELARLEKAAYKKFYEDGLFDVYLGILLFLMPVVGMLDGWIGGNEALSLLVLLVGYAVFVFGFIVGRKRFVTPRIGTFKPGAERRAKITKTRLVLVGSVLLGLVVFAISTAAYGGGDHAATFLDFIPAIWFVNATVVFAGMAYYLDVPRFYAYGPIFGSAVMLDLYPKIWFDLELSPLISFGIPAAIIVGVGVYKLVHFVRDYPARDDGMALDGLH